MATSPEIACRDFNRPDDRLDFKDHGWIDVVKMPDGTAAMHAVLKPGWSWARDEKPLLGDPDTCPMAHTGYCIEGELVVMMVASGERRVIRRGDFFEIPAGHEAYVPGGETCELILMSPPDHAQA